jgi:hypothetical protein
MSDNPRARPLWDCDTIDINEGWELHYWSQKFGISQERLKEIVLDVGSSTKDVEHYLATSAHSVEQFEDPGSPARAPYDGGDTA